MAGRSVTDPREHRSPTAPPARPDQLCAGTKADGDPCQRPPTKGAAFCHHHAGQAQADTGFAATYDLAVHAAQLEMHASQEDPGTTFDAHPNAVHATDARYDLTALLADDAEDAAADDVDASASDPEVEWASPFPRPGAVENERETDAPEWGDEPRRQERAIELVAQESDESGGNDVARGLRGIAGTEAEIPSRADADSARGPADDDVKSAPETTASTDADDDNNDDNDDDDDDDEAMVRDVYAQAIGPERDTGPKSDVTLPLIGKGPMDDDELVRAAYLDAFAKRPSRSQTADKNHDTIDSTDRPWDDPTASTTGATEEDVEAAFDAFIQGPAFDLVQPPDGPAVRETVRKRQKHASAGPSFMLDWTERSPSRWEAHVAPARLYDRPSDQGDVAGLAPGADDVAPATTIGQRAHEDLPPPKARRSLPKRGRRTTSPSDEAVDDEALADPKVPEAAHKQH